MTADGYDLLNLRDRAKAAKKIFKKNANWLKQLKPNDADRLMSALHDEAFEEIDCLKCANCCKTTSPIFKAADIERIAKHLGTKAADVENRYLKVDNEGDWVLKSSPCVFLNGDNYCSIYESRPKACREYPHTNRKRIQQLIPLSLKNTEICPAVFQIFQRLNKRKY